MNIYQLINADQARDILKVIKDNDWSEGLARTRQLTGTMKHNQEILSNSNDKLKDLLTRIGHKIMQNPEIQLNHIPVQVHPPKFSRYVSGDYYNRHTDAPWMGVTRTDLACTMWLSDPDSYEGGELRIGGKRLKGKAGQCVVYNCGVPHEVTPVTSGERICAILWIQSRIRDPIKRQLVSDFRKFLSKLEDDQQALFLEGGTIHSALIRMWME